MSILLLEKNVGLRNLMEELLEDREKGIYVYAWEETSGISALVKKMWRYELVIMGWEDFGRTTLNAILDSSKDFNLPPQIWVLTEDTQKVHREAPEANLILSKKEHFGPEVLKMLVKRFRKNEEEKRSRRG